MQNGYQARLGNFFILVGCAFLILFLASVFANEFNLLYLFITAGTLFIGFLLRSLAPRPEHSRFLGIRKASQRSRQHREEKEKERKNDLWQP